MNEVLQFLEHLISTVPLEVFLFIGTCLDEIISPIPAFFVLIPAGIAAHVQELPLWYLSVLALISGIARALSGYILYLCADKLEDILFGRGQKFFGTTHKDIEQYGKKLASKNKLTSWLLLFTMHALPVFPGTLLSLGSGVIRLPLSIFFSATILGSSTVALFFLYLGYTGTQTTELLSRLDTTTQIITIAIVGGGITWLAVHYYKAKRLKRH
jgi:membrane protein DedA with SNARE-associated domain